MSDVGPQQVSVYIAAGEVRDSQTASPELTRTITTVQVASKQGTCSCCTMGRAQAQTLSRAHYACLARSRTSMAASRETTRENWILRSSRMRQSWFFAEKYYFYLREKNGITCQNGLKCVATKEVNVGNHPKNTTGTRGRPSNFESFVLTWRLLTEKM